MSETKKKLFLLPHPHVSGITPLPEAALNGHFEGSFKGGRRRRMVGWLVWWWVAKVGLKTGRWGSPNREKILKNLS